MHAIAWLIAYMSILALRMHVCMMHMARSYYDAPYVTLWHSNYIERHAANIYIRLSSSTSLTSTIYIPKLIRILRRYRAELLSFQIRFGTEISLIFCDFWFAKFNSDLISRLSENGLATLNSH